MFEITEQQIKTNNKAVLQSSCRRTLMCIGRAPAYRSWSPGQYSFPILLFLERWVMPKHVWKFRNAKRLPSTFVLNALQAEQHLKLPCNSDSLLLLLFAPCFTDPQHRSSTTPSQKRLAQHNNVYISWSWAMGQDKGNGMYPPKTPISIAIWSEHWEVNAARGTSRWAWRGHHEWDLPLEYLKLDEVSRGNILSSSAISRRHWQLIRQSPRKRNGLSTRLQDLFPSFSKTRSCSTMLFCQSVGGRRLVWDLPRSCRLQSQERLWMTRRLGLFSRTLLLWGIVRTGTGRFIWCVDDAE